MSRNTETAALEQEHPAIAKVIANVERVMIGKRIHSDVLGGPSVRGACPAGGCPRSWKNNDGESACPLGGMQIPQNPVYTGSFAIRCDGGVRL